MINLHHGSLLREQNQQDQDQQLSWPDKHRPKTVEEVALPSELRTQVQEWLSPGFPKHNILLHGLPATGKSSLAEAIAAEVFPEKQVDHVVRIKAAQTRSIEFVRDKLIKWIHARGGLIRAVDGDWKGLAVISEADGFTPESQASLKDAIEDYSGSVRFIFTTNRLERLDEAIQSRCEVIELPPPPVGERVRVLQRILAAEGAPQPEEELVEFCKAFIDLRDMLRTAQDSIAVEGRLTLPPPKIRKRGVEELWPDPVDGQLLLRDVQRTFERFLSLPDGAPLAVALWVVYAHCFDAFDISPLLAVTSPVKRSGKSTLFNVLSRLVPTPLFASNMSAAAVYRAVDARAPTLLADEADSWFSMRDDMRGIWNSGHTRWGARVLRSLGAGGLEELSTWCPKALALIRSVPKDLPSTIADRSIVISMRRRTPEEQVDRLRLDRLDAELSPLRMKAARWSADNIPALRDLDPSVPTDMDDRAADNWRPLLAIAELIGENAASRARLIARRLADPDGDIDEEGVAALADLRLSFAEEQTDRLPSQVIVSRLNSNEERPWGKRLDPRHLARLLRPFGIRSRSLWAEFGGQRSSVKGYFRDDCTEAFRRYLSEATHVLVA